MSLETAQYVHQLNASNPSGADRLKDGDDHLRMIKSALLSTFPGIKGPLDASVTHTLLNGVAALLVPIGTIVMWTGTEANVPAGWAICDGRTVNKSDGSATIQTPNLVDRAPTGANVAGQRPVGTAYGAFSYQITTDSGGAHGHTASTSAAGSHSHGGATAATSLSVDQIPAHSHYEFANAAGSYGNIQNSPEGAPNREANGSSSGASYSIGGSGGQANVGRSSTTGGGQGHAHGISGDGVHTHAVTVDSGGGHAHSVAVNVAQPSFALYFIMKI